MAGTGPAMELGSSFRSYEDFRKRFRAYELAQGCRYSLQSCVSVRCYNRQHGTAVRQDVMFMQVKFGCGRTQTYTKKRKKHPDLCPAYFVLQYKEDIDRLVISELNNVHVHADPVLSLIRAAAVTANAVACSSPAARLCEEQQLCGTNSVAVADKDSQVVVVGQLVNRVTALYEAPMIPEAAKENISALVRVAEVMKTFLRVDRGSLASVSTDSNHGLDRLSFQTSKMNSSFVQFHKSLLLHRALGKEGCVLYAFIAESKERVGKVVHLSLLKEDTGHRFRKMLTVFKEFNPEWRKVQVVFVDVFFCHKAILQELFPSAQVLLSVYHTVQLLKKNVKEATTSSFFKQKLRLALRKVMFAPSAANRDALSQMAKYVISPELYDYLQANWFTCEPLWCMHADKGLQFCSTHMASLDLITHRISSLFGQQLSLEVSVLHFMQCADCLDSKGWESPNWGFLSTEDGQSGLWEKPNACTGAAAEPDPSPPAAKLQVTEIPEGNSEEEINQRTEECIKQSLRDICTEPAAKLCLSEFAVVQKSVQLIGTREDAFSIQVLEDAHTVDVRGCTCHFNQVFRLPCRHILAVLNSDRKTLQPEMLSSQWQKGSDAHRAGQDSPDGVLEVLKSSWNESLDKSLLVSFLTAEISRLLTHCSGEEFERRYRTLRELADSWIGPYIKPATGMAGKPAAIPASQGMRGLEEGRVLTPGAGEPGLGSPLQLVRQDSWTLRQVTVTGSVVTGTCLSNGCC
ncbi:zinc finger swim hypothetical protein [Limosa lapponica baueri]|uniref:SWIM-type domain-containing protein n=1 Tax=Limosa lapponica baueri TaxID=1758121 RepID=A0A2I0TI67_LIMLA|nr:zinc finger swim hypothetical protein [Limosa lapponica baueri]